MNDYLYVQNNPVVYKDNSGLGKIGLGIKALEWLKAAAASYHKGSQVQKKMTQSGKITGSIFDQGKKNLAIGAGVGAGVGLGAANPGYSHEMPYPNTPPEPKKSPWDKMKDAYDNYDQWGKDTYRYSANWWFRLFHGGQDYNGCNGLFDPDDFADLMWLLTSPI